MKPIVGYEDYMIDIDGNVYSMKYGKIRKLHPGKTKRGYLTVALLDDGEQKSFYIHRLVYLAFVGEITNKMEIDHIDRNPSNNKLNNLRLVTRSQNNFNRNAKGYYWHKQKKKWMAYIALNKKRIHLGYFDTEAEAKAAYLEAKDKLHII